MKKIQNTYLLAILLPLIMLAVAVLPVNGAADLGFGAPSIQITSPNENATIPAGNVTITAHVDDLTLVSKLGQASVAGEGHIHYFMDVAVPTTPGKPALTAAGTYYPTANTSYTWTNVMPGMHNFTAELVNNDHTPLVPAKYTMINMTVTGTASAAAPAAAKTSMGY